jgi:hypothetical protein
MLTLNRVIKILISADLMFNAASGFINPVFAIFLVQAIEGGSVKLAGTAVAIYWITVSTLRIPIAYFLDKKQGEYDDFYSMIIGFIVFAAAHFLYIFAQIPAHIYAIQFLMGLGGAFAFTPWYGFFTRHIDLSHESFDWSIEVSVVGYGLAAAGFLSGLIVNSLGFTPLFIISGIIALAGVVLLSLIGKNIQVVKKENYVIKVKK